MTSKSNNIINAGEIISIRNNNENKVLINSVKQWLIFTLLQYNNVHDIKIKHKLIIINKNNKHKLIKLKYSIILNIIFDPIIEYISTNYKSLKREVKMIKIKNN